MKRRVKNIEHTVNKDTGEIITTRKEFTIGTTTEEFFLVFLANLDGIFNIKSANDLKALAYMCGACQFNTNIVHLTQAVRKEMCTKLNITNQTLSNSLGSLKRHGLVQGDGGTFTINPEIMWRGSVKERNRWMKDEGFEVMIKFRDITKLQNDGDDKTEENKAQDV